jgi:hypothetical protein
MSQIRIAFGDRGDSLSDLAAAASQLPPSEASVQRLVVLEAAQSGLTSAGAVLDHLGALDAAGRREVLNRAGQPAAAPRRVQPVSSTLARDERGCAFQVCNAPGCQAHPLDPNTGGVIAHPARRWWCSEHEDLAQPGDLDAWSPGIRFAAGGGFEFAEEVDAETARLGQEAERRAHDREQRRAEAIAALPAMERARAAEMHLWTGANLMSG